MAALSTRDVATLSTDQVVALSTNQIGGLTSTQMQALTAPQFAAMSSDQIQALSLGTPIVLDLNGNGQLTESKSVGVQFDLYANGQAVQTGWTAPGEGLLVLTRGDKGQITSGAQLLGNETVLPDGSKAANGYAALTALNGGSGAITAADPLYNELGVWINRSNDGVSAPDQIFSLASLGITSLQLNATDTAIGDNGNLIGMVSSYTTNTGQTHEMADVWFATSTPVGSTATSSASGLQSNVGSLVNALAGFSASPATGSTASSSSSANLAQSSTSTTSLVQALAQFDANGTVRLGTPATTPALATTVASGNVTTLGTAVLALGKS